MCVMFQTRGGLLAQIQADVVDDSKPLSSLLQKCIVLGGQAKSADMRDWARRELNGYLAADTVPDYRHVPAVLMALITNRAGYNGNSTRVDPGVFAPQIREILREKEIDLEDAIFAQGVGELEALAGQGKDVHDIIPSWAGVIAGTLNSYHMGPTSRVKEVYWSVPNASIRGILVRIRTALADLVAELIALTPRDQEVPDRQAADQVIQFIVTGDRSVIHYSPQHAADGGTNVTVGGGAAPGPVTVSGAHGNAIGSQTASGAHSSVVGAQVVQAGGDAVTSGQDTKIPPVEDQLVPEGWWARLRKRGAVVAFATIIGAIAAIAGVAVAILIAAGWKP